MNPESTSLEEIDQIIDYNRSLWGGRFNPIILTDGKTIDDKWWQFLRDIDPDVIKPLVPLDIKLIEKIEDFLSPLAIEPSRNNEQSHLETQVSVYDTPAEIDINSVNFTELKEWYGGPTLGIFNLDEMDDDIGKRFVLRNFGTYKPTHTRLHIRETFSVPESLKDALEQGTVPVEIHEGFKKAGIPLSREVFSKKSVQNAESWAIIDKVNKQIHYVNLQSSSLSVQPQTQRFLGELSEINKKVCITTDRESLATTLIELARAPNIVFRDQMCAAPNSERDIEEDTKSVFFEVIVGETLQDIVYFWNRPLLIPKWKRASVDQMWLPKILATDSDMAEALYAWFPGIDYWTSESPEILRFVSFSTDERELGDIASRFRGKLGMKTAAKCFREPQIPNFRPEDSSFRHIGDGMDIHRAQDNEAVLELVEPKELTPHDVNGHWMADFYIEFISDGYRNQEEIRMRLRSTPFWRLPNRNYLARYMFNKPSRIRRNGFPSVMMRLGENVLRLKLADADSVVASLFRRYNRPVYKRDPRTRLVVRPYASTETSDKGKYLRGMLELFGNLAFAFEVLGNPYWRAMFDALSKTSLAEQYAYEAVANKMEKLIGQSDPLADNPRAINSLSKIVINESKKLDLKQKELPFDKFMQETKYWWKKAVAHLSEFEDESEMTMVDLGFGKKDVKHKLGQLTQQNIIQIGVKPRCSTCGMVHWYHVDDIGQHLTCQGCRSQFPLHPELTWHYRLNSLIHAAHALHGATPVILVLGKLLEESRTSFLLSPNLDLLTEPQDESCEKLDKAAEVDIACIQDGKFIIGEVKQSMDLFKPKDFDSMAEIAKRTKPDVVLFACIDSQQPKRRITENIERIQKKLSSLEIDVKWYKLEHLDYSIGV
ncbi:MAG: hypothetical protein OXN17_19040 [Candidatus Poribacteria bacterium]|nr:hypothetical protein [Candidatus Poribacteria bacterium]